jgi:Fe2+ transport system protein FeoA
MGQSAVIAEVSGDRGFRRRLLELGLLPGTRVKMMRRAPLGDPLELFVRETSMSIRVREASQITIESTGQ